MGDAFLDFEDLRAHAEALKAAAAAFGIPTHGSDTTADSMPAAAASPPMHSEPLTFEDAAAHADPVAQSMAEHLAKNLGAATANAAGVGPMFVDPPTPPPHDPSSTTLGVGNPFDTPPDMGGHTNDDAQSSTSGHIDEYIDESVDIIDMYGGVTADSVEAAPLDPMDLINDLGPGSQIGLSTLDSVYPGSPGDWPIDDVISQVGSDAPPYVSDDSGYITPEPDILGDTPPCDGM